MAKKYYWLKLQKDFFKRHDIRIIEDMPNGKDYILFYMKLLVESISHEGELRFSDTIPYNEQMLSTITHTNIDIVRSAINIFSELHLMELMDNGTIFMSEVSQMMGTETEWAEKKRLYRESKEGQKKTLSDKSKRLELEKELDIEKDIVTTAKKPKSDLLNHFEKVWELYPNKKGKGSIEKSNAKLKVIYSKTLEEWKILIDRYNRTVKDKQFLMHGSTFFNTGYIDYLDENYQEAQLDKSKKEN
jgi:predicted phage replisome organizer